MWPDPQHTSTQTPTSVWEIFSPSFIPQPVKGGGERKNNTNSNDDDDDAADDDDDSNSST